MEFILLPADMMRSNEYRRLQNVDKLFLIGIYTVHGKESSFHIDAKNARQYIGKDLTNYALYQKIGRIVDSGLIRFMGRESSEITGGNIKKFEFLYPAIEN